MISPFNVVVGETGSGKSALAIRLAEQFDGEVICADALTVRRGVDIGTAKPNAEERARVPHHLLDVVGPCGDFTAAVFKRLAFNTISDIENRNKLPIMAGGTGLYIEGVIYDYGFLPAGDRTARQTLNDMTVEQLRELIKQKGLDDSDLDVRNKRRLIRLLETEGARPTRKAMRPNTLLLGIKIPREELRQRITARTEQMLEQGLEREVRQLADTYGWDCEALKGIGYREWREYFEGSQNLEHIKARIIKSTMDLAKRQRTWFKRNKDIQWVNNPSNAVNLVTAFLNK